MSNEKLLMRLTIEAFLADYMHAIDADRLEDWHSFFAEDGVYRVTTRENHELGLPLSLMICRGHGMLKDRISALRTANIYEPHVYCHIPGAFRITDLSKSKVSGESTFTVMRTMSDGTTIVFACGRTIDTFALRNDELKFAERTIILDSRQIDTLLVIPL